MIFNHINSGLIAFKCNINVGQYICCHLFFLSAVPVCNACISFSEFTSCHSLSSWDLTSSPSAAAPRQEKQEKKETGQRNTGAEPVTAELYVMCTVTSRLPRWHSLSGARWAAGAEVEQGEAKNEEDREGQTCHVWGQWILWDGTQRHNLYCRERDQ